MTLILSSLNVRGLRQPLRRTAIFCSLRSLHFDVMFIQECNLLPSVNIDVLSREWGKGPSFWSAGKGRGDGVGVLFGSWDFSVSMWIAVVPGRILMVEGMWRACSFRAVCVYAPAVPGERSGFFDVLEPLFCTNRTLWVGGDFNVDIAVEASLSGVLGAAGLCDAVVQAGGPPGLVTWRNSRGAETRLDYIFVSSHQQASGWRVFPFWCTDHCLVWVKCTRVAEKRGPGLWRLNVSYLQDPAFRAMFINVYIGWRGLQSEYGSLCEWWESTKTRVRAFCIRWGRQLARKQEVEVLRLSAQLQSAWVRSAVDEVARISCVLKGIFDRRARAHCLQSGIDKLLYGESPTSFFFRQVRTRQQRAHIGSLVEGDRSASAVPDMLEMAAGFYDSLFCARQGGQSRARPFLDSLDRRLTREEAASLEDDLSLSELEEAMRSLKVGKSPGGDGLPVEWYRTFWQLVGPDLLAVLGEVQGRGLLTDTMRVGHISLLFKKGGKEDLRNWRPLTLLTVDYKILTKALTLRMKRVLGSVISPDQTCGIPGRSCFFNLALVRDVVEWAQQRGVPLALLSLDQEKAFDRVDHSFLMASLDRMGFGPVFCGWVEILYRDVVSKVGVNGFYSAPVWQRRGVRQGCPLSPLLYVVFLEPLVAAFRRCPHLTGLHLPGGRGRFVKVSAYADDMTVFLNTDRDFLVVERLLEEFSCATGAVVNKGKSMVLCLGPWAGRSSVPGGFSVCVDGLRVLGVRFWRRDSPVRNWGPLVAEVQGRVSQWSGRRLSLSARVLVSKADLLSRVAHLAHVYPVPYLLGRRLERILFRFIWRGGRVLVARQCMFLDVKEGGRGAVSVLLKLACFFYVSTVRLMCLSEDSLCRYFPRFWLGFVLRRVVAWKGTDPWSNDRPGYFQGFVGFLRSHSWCLSDGMLFSQRRLYHLWLLDERPRVLGESPVADVDWLALQPVWLSGECRDLHWLGALGRLPVRERLYRHGEVGSPACVGGCGEDETVDHVMWSCPKLSSLWSVVGVWCKDHSLRVVLCRDLVRYGRGLGNRPLVWFVLSVAKLMIWELRAACLRGRRTFPSADGLKSMFLRRIKRDLEVRRSVLGPWSGDWVREGVG